MTDSEVIDGIKRLYVEGVKIGIPVVQRTLGVGYAQAARCIKELNESAFGEEKEAK